MKILVLSDSHGSLTNVKKATEKFGINADVIVHCGDATRGEAQWIMENCKHCMTVCVKGNCDFGSMLKSEEILSLDGVRIFVTHGHLYNAKLTLANLSYKAEESNCNLVLFGHTHVPTNTVMGGVRLVNPGSASAYDASCAVIETDGKGNVLVNHVKIC